MKTVVLLNRKADSGKAGRKWLRMAPRLLEALGEAAVVHDETRDWRRSIRDAAGDGACLVVAAGGDGTVHRAVNLLLSLPERVRSRVLLGAVGLGSSNDFHRPARRSERILGLPVRCSPGRTVRQNVLRADWLDPAGTPHTGYAVTSASLGMVALGNHLFNRRWGPVGVCRPLSPAAGIWCASLASLCLQQAIPVKLSVDGAAAHNGKACLLGFYVNRHFAGGMSYPGPTDVVSPKMGVWLLPEAGLLRRVSLMAAALRGTLPGPPRALAWQARGCDCILGRPALLEVDGEAAEAQRVRIRLIPGGLRLCA